MNKLTIRPQFTLIVVALTAFFLNGCATSGPPENGDVAGPQKRVSGTVGDVREIILELPTGDVEVVSVPGSYISAELEMRCDANNSSCLRLAENVRLKKQVFENRMYIGTSTRSKFAFRNARSNYRIQVPDNIPLRIIMGYGALNVKGVRNNLTIDMKAGNINVEAPISQVRKVWADANFGDAKVVGTGNGREGERRLLVGAEASWDKGPGKYDIVVNLGAGDITVALSQL